MPANADKRKASLIDKSARLARDRGTPSIEGFVRRYYEHVPHQDILEVSADDLYGAAAAHRAFAAQRRPGQAKVRVYNPRQGAHGWGSAHTVVEVVNDDMPFLVDSVSAALNRKDLIVHFVIHPILEVRRGKSGRWLEPTGGDEPDAIKESLMRFEVTTQSGERLAEIAAAVTGVLDDVRAAVDDWQTIRDRMRAIIEELRVQPPGIDVEDADEVRDFLRWVHDDNFTFLGYREYDIDGDGAARLSVTAREGLGILRASDARVFDVLSRLEALSPEVRALVQRPDLLMVTKSNFRSTVHRPVHMDAICVKRLDAAGRAVGQRLVVGLFTSAAYNLSPRDIPLLRRKLRRVVERAGFPGASHDAKALAQILETYPRDELFQVSDGQLFETSLGILNLQDRQRVALFIRADDFERFVSCLIYVPRDRYTTALRLRVQEILEECLDGTVRAHYIQLGDAPLARLHVIVQTTPGQVPAYDVDAVERRLIEAARSWTDHLADALVAALGEERGLEMCAAYGDAFRADYQEHFAAAAAVADIAKIEQAMDTGTLAMNLYRPADAAPEVLHLKLFNPDRPIPLSDVLPMLEHMGLRVIDELPHAVTPRRRGRERVWIHDFGLETRRGNGVDADAVRAKFEETFARVWAGDMDSDDFNGLVLLSGLGWRQVMVLRALCKFLRQAGIAFSEAYMAETLADNPGLARLVVELFAAIFDPAAGAGGKRRAGRIRRRLMEGLDKVMSADQDRIVRRFVNLVEATLRTNFFQKGADGEPKPYLSFKFDSQALDELPLPRPLREIFVYSPRLEGVHMRFGPVARGGLRWSDRREDFRTEVLGLVKAQQVKNAVIVPVGSKGGFVLKRPPAGGDRKAFLDEGIACYRIFVSALLDLTDNFEGNRVVPPPDVVRRDGDDPYLVVAADKGTATFSDIANAVSADHGFWLGDAFASGGSVGYDHKKMGITARGAWESVKRHFREMGVDTQKEPFTVVGIGDMSGDVFGNAMLLSRHIRLLGAFNHRHIFLDPDADEAKSFAERRRLFRLAGSGWNDYAEKRISKGGGVFERSAKSIPISAQVRKRFGIAESALTPGELMRVVLAAEVDLLWFGGIGTYVKARDESDAEVGDRANDALRVNGAEVRAQVIGEGANLAVTQRGRIEYALKGGRLNADSIDNSAGVDCSDHEVNIKIALDSVVAKGGLDGARRNALLARMTDEVGALCLADNYQQSQAITLIQERGVAALDDQVRLMRMLERAGLLDRAIEFLPDDETLEERAQAKQGLTRPEIGVLLSYSKNWLFAELLRSDFPDDAHLADDLAGYFPSLIRADHETAIAGHRLRREIIATVTANALVNRAGATFVTQFMEKTGMAAADIARAFNITVQVFALDRLWSAIEALDNRVPAAVQAAMLLDVDHLLDWVTLWFLRKGAAGLDLGAHVARFQGGIQALSRSLDTVLPPHYVDDLGVRGRPYLEQSVPEELALGVGGLVNLFSACDIVDLANRRRLEVPRVAKLYFAVGTRFHLGGLRAAADGLDSETHWQKLAVAALIEEIYGHQLALAGQVLDFAQGKAGPRKAINAWSEANRQAVDQTDQLLAELHAAAVTDISMVAVASRQLRALAEASAG